jgi:tetratricopeptide (TPR) repeat protein
LLAGAYFVFNPSYRLSLEARYYFETGNYEEAYKLASEAFTINPYNRMAFTLKTQSKIAKEWQSFINDADNYFQTIEKIANKPVVTKKDKLRIKMMLEILLDEYKTLKPSLLLPPKLKKEAKEKYLKAKKLYEELFE